MVHSGGDIIYSYSFFWRFFFGRAKVVSHRSRFGRKDVWASFLFDPWILHLVRLFFQASFPHAASFPYYCNRPGQA